MLLGISCDLSFTSNYPVLFQTGILFLSNMPFPQVLTFQQCCPKQQPLSHSHISCLRIHSLHGCRNWQS